MSEVVFECQDFTYRYEVFPCEQGHVANMWMKPGLLRPMETQLFTTIIVAADPFGENVEVGTEEQAVKWCIERRIKYRVPQYEKMRRKKNGDA